MKYTSIQFWEVIKTGKFDREDTKTDTQWKIKDDFIAFEGSRSKKDWIQNFRFLIRPFKKESYKNSKIKWYIHCGVKIKWKGIENQVKEYLDNYKGKELYLTGHSQGGALALLCHEFIKFNYPNIKVNTITFGAPRIVFWINLKKIKNRWCDVINYQKTSDMVPRLPPVIFGYRHVGTKVKLKSKFNIKKMSDAHNDYGSYLE